MSRRNVEDEHVHRALKMPQRQAKLVVELGNIRAERTRALQMTIAHTRLPIRTTRAAELVYLVGRSLYTRETRDLVAVSYTHLTLPTKRIV